MANSERLHLKTYLLKTYSHQLKSKAKKVSHKVLTDSGFSHSPKKVFHQIFFQGVDLWKIKSRFKIFQITLKFLYNYQWFYTHLPFSAIYEKNLTKAKNCTFALKRLYFAIHDFGNNNSKRIAKQLPNRVLVEVYLSLKSYASILISVFSFIPEPKTIVRMNTGLLLFCKINKRNWWC